ncbi:MAG: NAD(P)-binding domain-containing protein [Gaiellaceae bacterium]
MPDERPFPPGDYPVVVVGSGPGGLQTSYCLERLGVRHAVLSKDDAPGGMFRLCPIFQRLLSWTEPDALADRGSRAYEWYDHNSLIAEEEANRACVAEMMLDDRSAIVPTRKQMEASLVAFAERTGIHVRYGCTWEATRREDDGSLVLTTSDGEYRCRAAIFALGVTTPWKPDIPGIEAVPHYAEIPRDKAAYEGKDVVVIGKRNSAFEIADGLEPWARRIVLLSPRPVDTSVIALSSVRVRYMQPLEHYQIGGGTFALDAAIERIERTAEGFRVHAQGTKPPVPSVVDADAVVAATGFRTPLLDLPELGVTAVAQGRIPALTPLWESAGAPGVFFAGNASQGAPGLRKHGVGSSSPAVHGFRYNARVLARHLATRLGIEVEREAIQRRELVGYLLRELGEAPELWTQKAYLARVVEENGSTDIVPLAHFLDAGGPDAVAATIEMNAQGTIYPVLYVRRSGTITERALEPRPLRKYETPEYAQEVAGLL